MKITIKDIARISGHGVSTVSRAINNSGYVSDSVKKDILKIVKDYNYIPNNSARNLKMSKSKNICLLVKGMDNPFFHQMIKVIEEKATLRGYPLLIQNVKNNANELDIAIEEKLGRNLCGVIFIGGYFSYSKEKFAMLDIPCVFLTVSAGENIPLDKYSSVKLDDVKEGYKATEYLISLGHKKIGFIVAENEGPATPNSLRFEGYKLALKDHGIEYKDSLVAKARDFSETSGYLRGFNAFKYLYTNNSGMTATFCFADILAIGAAKAAMSMGLNIPKDISIVGFDGIELSEYFHPSLDTIYQPSTELGIMAIDTLLDVLQGGDNRHIVYNGVLLKRGSCAKT